MSKKDDGFEEFLLFKTVTGGGGCLVSALTILGIVGLIAGLII